MTAHPLANLLAVATPDGEELAAIRARIEVDAAFDLVWEPAPRRLVASRRLPLGDPDEEAVRAAGLAIAQGRDELGRSGKDWEAIAGLVSERPERLEELPGDFGLIHFHRGGEATVVRSAGGLVPFYVACEGDRWIVTTTMALMVRFRPTRLELDPLVNAIWTSGYDAAPDRRTFFNGVKVLGRGEFARLDGGDPRFGSWWNPRRAEPRLAAEHAERLRSALIGTLERELDQDGENLLALSGGVDSSAVGALAAGLLDRSVSTLTVLGESEEARREDLRYVDALDQEVGFKRRKAVEINRQQRLDLLDEPRVPFHVLQPYLCLLPSVAREWPVTVLFGGEFADHTVGSALTIRDWANHTTLGGLWRSRNALPTGPLDVRRWFVHRLRRAVGRSLVPWPNELPKLIHPDLRVEYAAWLRERRRQAADDDGPMPYLAMFLERQGFLGMHWEVASSLDVRRCFPFVTRELLELGFECHPSELVGPGPKRLLRAALADDVPTAHLERRKEVPDALPDRGEWRFAGELPPAVAAILAPEWDPRARLPYWDVLRVRQLVALTTAVESGGEDTGWEVHA